MTVEEGDATARDCFEDPPVGAPPPWLDGLRALKLLGRVHSTGDFIEQHRVINGASDLLHEIFGSELGHRARSAVGFAVLPTGAAVEVEAILEVV